MQVRRASMRLFIICFAVVGTAKIVPPAGSLNTERLFATSDLVCVGEVSVSALESGGSSGSATTMMALSRVYKGASPSSIEVVLPTSGRGRHDIDNKPDNMRSILAFLHKSPNGSYLPTDPQYPYFEPSLLGNKLLASGSADGLSTDLIAGITTNGYRTTINLELLYGFSKVEDLQPIRSIAAGSDIQNQVWAFAILIKNRDFQSVAAAKQLINRIPDDRPTSYDTGPLIGAISQLDDERALPLILDVAASNNRYFRGAAVSVLRRMRNPRAVPALIAHLDDADRNTALECVKALAEITGKSDAEYSPSVPEFFSSPAKYVGAWKIWWQTEGKETYTRTPSK